MKKIHFALFAIPALALILAAQVRADDSPEVCCTIVTANTQFVGTPGLTVQLLADLTAAPEDRIAYVQNLKDDAAEYVALNGVQSAVLANAIRAVRSQVASEKTASDQDVARYIMNADISI